VKNPFLPNFADLPSELPVFPLSGAVVMPGVQLPLNIFEPRYLNMVQAALAGDHLIGMLQPRTDNPLSGESAETTVGLHRVGCAGRITSYSEMNDGRIVMVLTGLCRFEFNQELPERDGYRCVRPEWDRFAPDYQDDQHSINDRAAFMDSLRTFCEQHNVEVPWKELDDMEDGDLVNLLCAHLPLSADDKQALIETVDLHERATLMRGLMDMSTLGNSRGSINEHRH
jgi:Lon protease-like protein